MTASTRRPLRRTARAVAALVALAFAACSSATTTGSGNPGGAAGAGGQGSPFGDGNGGGVTIPGAGAGAGPGSGVGLEDGGACVSVTQVADFIPLDMYLLIDRSSSMLESTTAGSSKWISIERALEAFIGDPGSEGFGVGLQYFPLRKAGVPATCTSDADCGAGGPCFLKSCASGGTLQICSTDSDCPAFLDSCTPFGICEFYPAGGVPTYCAPIGGACPIGLGSCLDIQDRWCVNGTVCDPSAYGTPEVPIATLPGSAAGLVASLRSVSPEGRTPTGPALSGAISGARAWASGHPERQVVAVLATDGLPTECTPTDITSVAALAADGLAGTPRVPTYVIGVFAPSDLDSPRNLQAIARAGGTQSAFIVDTSGDVTAQFRAALDSIRSSTRLSCELKLPTPPAGSTLDYGAVNLELVPGSGARKQLVNVGSAARCSTAPGAGWYYDVDPGSGGSPTKLQVCPDVCAAFGASTDAKVNLQLGCATIVR